MPEKIAMTPASLTTGKRVVWESFWQKGAQIVTPGAIGSSPVAELLEGKIDLRGLEEISRGRRNTNAAIVYRYEDLAIRVVKPVALHGDLNWLRANLSLSIALGNFEPASSWPTIKTPEYLGAVLTKYYSAFIMSDESNGRSHPHHNDSINDYVDNTCFSTLQVEYGSPLRFNIDSSVGNTLVGEDAVVKLDIQGHAGWSRSVDWTI